MHGCQNSYATLYKDPAHTKLTGQVICYEKNIIGIPTSTETSCGTNFKYFVNKQKKDKASILEGRFLTDLLFNTEFLPFFYLDQQHLV